jgi:hypothetical protein
VEGKVVWERVMANDLLRMRLGMGRTRREGCLLQLMEKLYPTGRGSLVT